MRILSNTNITNTAQLPIKKGTIKFLQDAHKETVISLVKAMVGSSYSNLTLYVLFGCVDSGSGLSHNISEGAIVILDEIYQIDAVAFTSASGEVPILNFLVQQYTTDADPVTFTDLSVHNVHNIRKYEIVSGASGSGAFDFSTLVRPVFDIATETARAVAREDLLAASLIDIRSAWTEDNNNSYVTVYGGTVTNVTNTFLRYKQIGKTMMISFSFNCSNTTAPTGFAILLPNSAQYGGNQFVSVPCNLADGVIPNHCRASLSFADRTHIQIYFAAGTLTNTYVTQVTGEITFDTL
jgi:hypothetical protein